TRRVSHGTSARAPPPGPFAPALPPSRRSSPPPTAPRRPSRSPRRRTPPPCRSSLADREVHLVTGVDPDALDLGVTLECVDAELAAEPALLVAAERQPAPEHAVVVDPHRPG